MLTKAQIKYIQSLRHKKYRLESGQFIVEGDKVAAEWVGEGLIKIHTIYALQGWIAENQGLLGSLHEKLVEVTPVELAKMSGLSTPQRVLVLADLPPEDPQPHLSGLITLLLEDIQDPGNMGTIIRTADWFGISQVIFSPASADPFGPKAVQASMGSLARVGVSESQPLRVLDSFPDIPSYAAVLQGRPLSGFPPIREGIILIGNESRGLSQGLASRCLHQVTIPGFGKASSLNAAVAAAIICARFTGAI